MRKTVLFAVLASALALTACNKDDSSVDASQIVGKWDFFHKGPKMYDSSLSYTFDRDGGYEKISLDVISETEVTTKGSYKIASDGRRITLRYHSGSCEEEYSVLQLTSQIMTWKAIAHGHQSEQEWFVKTTDDNEESNVHSKGFDDSAMLVGVWEGACNVAGSDGFRLTEGVRLELDNDGKYLCHSTTYEHCAVGTGAWSVSGGKIVFRTGTILDAMMDWTSIEPFTLDGEFAFTMQDNKLILSANKGDCRYEYTLTKYN